MTAQPWQFGVAAAFSASLLGVVGVQLRILADALLARDAGEIACHLLRGSRQDMERGATASWPWQRRGPRRARCLQLAGWATWIGGQALGQVAILLAPATIVASVTFSSSLLCNTLLAPVLLRETLTRAHGAGVVLLAAGGSAVTSVAAHASASPDQAPLHMEQMWTRTGFVALATAALGIAALLAAKALRRGSLDVLSFAYLFALCGAVDLTVTKCTLQLLASSVETKSDGASPPPTCIVGVFFLVMTVLHLAVLGCQVASTRYGDALQNTPLFLGSGALMQVAFSGTFFGEFAGLGDARTAAFALGFAAMLLGLGVISRAAAPASERTSCHAAAALQTAAAPALPQARCGLQKPAQRAESRGQPGSGVCGTTGSAIGPTLAEPLLTAAAPAGGALRPLPPLKAVPCGADGCAGGGVRASPPHALACGCALRAGGVDESLSPAHCCA